MNRVLFFAFMLLSACAVSRSSSDTRTEEVELLDDTTYLLTQTTDDKTYGYKKSNPVKVGGVTEDEGPLNERRFLNALTGPNGERVIYSRGGSCCAFKTPNGLFDNTGMLDRYEITWLGAVDTLDIYINMYDKGNLKIPVGLFARDK